jgi:cell division septation protein DedD
MKDKQISEEEIFKDLDTMYKRVADVEKEEAEEAAAEAGEVTEAEAGEVTEAEAAETTLQKKEKLQPKKKQPSRSSRRPIIIASIAVVVVIFALAMTIFKPMIAKLIPGMGETPSIRVAPPPPQRVKPFTKPSVNPPATPPAAPSVNPLATIPAAPSDQPSAPVPIPKEQEAMKTPPKEEEALKPTLKEQEPVKPALKEVEKAKPLPQETAKLEKTFTQERYYAIQVGAFQNLEYARDLVESLKKDGLDAYWISKVSKKKGTLYRVFVGQFANKNEAVRFLKEQKALNHYPGSYPQKVSSPKIPSPKLDPQ